jgi:hypothetical protein
MKPTVRVGILLLLCAQLLLACSSVPAQWSKDLIFELRCGMSVAEVERVTGRHIEDKTTGGAAKDSRGTHAIESDDHRTIVWLVFLERGLQSFRISWSEAAIGYGVPKSTSQIDLCSAK